MSVKGEKTREKILLAINDYKTIHKYSPTIRELCDYTGIKSSSSIHRHLEVLKKKGYVDWDPTCPRTLRILNEDN